MCHVLCMESVHSWIDFLIVLFMDCVQSWSISRLFLEGVQSFVKVLFVESVQSWSRHQKLQEDWLGTKDEIGSSNVHLDSSNLHLDLVLQELILVTAPKLQEDEIGTKMSATILSSL